MQTVNKKVIPTLNQHLPLFNMEERNLFLQYQKYKGEHAAWMLISFPLFWSVHRYITDFMFSRSLLVDTGGNLNILVKIFFSVVPLGLWELSCLTRDWTQAPAVEELSSNPWTVREFLVYPSCIVRGKTRIGFLTFFLFERTKSIWTTSNNTPGSLHLGF